MNDDDQAELGEDTQPMLKALAARENQYDGPLECCFPLVRPLEGDSVEALLAASGPCLTWGAPPPAE